jgi:catechol 2,3-dioxygenase-like lactoylglutathione lyase family enzyme
MLRNKLIGLGFELWTLAVRARRVLGSIGRPRLHGIDHITIPVHDLAVARRFYCEVLGAAYLMTVDDATLQKHGRPPAADQGEGVHHISVLLGGQTRIDLFLQHKGQAGAELGHPHYAFRVPPGDMLTWKQRLHSAGVPTDGPLQLGPPGQASLYFNDPSGNHLEVTTHGFVGSVEVRAPEMRRLVPTHAPRAESARGAA